MLLREQIHTREALQVLLTLQRDPNEAWTSRALSTALQIAQDTVEDALGELCSAGLIAARTLGVASWFRYSPTTQTVDDAVRRLVSLYDETPLEVMSQLNANAIERVRSAARPLLRGRGPRSEGDE